MPTISMFRGIKIYINWNDHMPPHFHASYAGQEIIVSINDLEVLDGEIPSKQLKMVLGWAAFHQTELIENWELAVKKQDLFTIDPLQSEVKLCRIQLVIFFQKGLMKKQQSILLLAGKNLSVLLRRIIRAWL